MNNQRSKYRKDLEECKKQIEMSIDYFNGSKKIPKRNALKSDSASAKLKTSNARSRNNDKGKAICKKYNSNNAVYKPPEQPNILSRNECKTIKLSKKENFITSGFNKLSNQKEKFQIRNKYSNKENDQKNSNKNNEVYNRKSLGGVMNTQSNLSSTGAYNSITKTLNNERPSAASQNSREYKNMTVRSRPIYQICETGASVECFSKTSQENRDASFSCNALSNSGLDFEVDNQEIIINDEINDDFTNEKKIREGYFSNKKNIEIIENKQPNDQESEKSSNSESAVSEGSLIVQNLPTSKIVFATK